MIRMIYVNDFRMQKSSQDDSAKWSLLGEGSLSQKDLSLLVAWLVPMVLVLLLAMFGDVWSCSKQLPVLVLV